MNSQPLPEIKFESEFPTAAWTGLAGLEHLLLGDLQSLLAEPLSETSRVWIERVLDLLLELLAGRFAAEEADGYLEEVIAAYPQWSEQVTTLQRQHSRLYGELAVLRARLRASDLRCDSAARLRRGLQLWMEELRLHDEAEIKLLSAERVDAALAL